MLTRRVLYNSGLNRSTALLQLMRRLLCEARAVVKAERAALSAKSKEGRGLKTQSKTFSLCGNLVSYSRSIKGDFNFGSAAQVRLSGMPTLRRGACLHRATKGVLEARLPVRRLREAAHDRDYPKAAQ